MDALRQDDIARARVTPPELRLKQALQAMSFGIRLQRRKIRARFPEASEAFVEQKLREWLRGDD